METHLISATSASSQPRARRWHRLAAAIATVASLGLAVPITSTAAPTDQSAEIVDYPLPVMEWAYAPAVVTVAPGSWVTWSNAGGETHTITSFDNSFDSREVGPSEGFSWFFETPGTFQYTCTLHPWMVGTITVVADEAAAGAGPTEMETPAMEAPAMDASAMEMMPPVDEGSPEPAYADPTY